jgi:tetratricopeptide (TPR) repeat protein
VNRLAVKQAPIKPGDQIIIGACVFEVVAAGTHLKRSVSAQSLAADKKLKEEEQKKIQRSKMMVGAGLLFLLMLAFSTNEEGVQTLRDRGRLPPSEEEVKPKKIKKSDLQKAIKDFVPMQSGADTPQRKQADVFYKQAMREYRQKNYLRSISAFETTLTIDPTFELARIQMKIAKQDMEKEIDLMYRRAVEDRKALRYRSACLNLKDVRNALEADQAAELYKKADDDLKKMIADGQCTDDILK